MYVQVPVQRVTKYPLLLARLLKVTPGHHKDRENIREAQTRIEAALEQINKDAKEIIAMKGSWRRGGGAAKKMGLQREMNNMRVRKLSLELLGWGREDTKFALEGRLTFAQVSDSNWRAKLKGTARDKCEGEGWKGKMKEKADMESERGKLREKADGKR